MHEMSIAASILDITKDELAKRHLHTLLRVEVHCGVLANIVADSLLLCFEMLTKGTPFEGAVLDVVEVPLRLRCRTCGATFEAQEQDALWLPCPHCAEGLGHEVLQGREFFIQQLEAE